MQGETKRVECYSNLYIECEIELEMYGPCGLNPSPVLKYSLTMARAPQKPSSYLVKLLSSEIQRYCQSHSSYKISFIIFGA